MQFIVFSSDQKWFVAKMLNEQCHCKHIFANNDACLKTVRKTLRIMCLKWNPVPPLILCLPRWETTILDWLNLKKAGCFLKFNKFYQMVAGQETHKTSEKNMILFQVHCSSKSFSSNFQTNIKVCMSWQCYNKDLVKSMHGDCLILARKTS